MRTTKLDVHNASVSTTSFRMDEEAIEAGGGQIPDNLAKLTLMVLKMHQANGDLAWVEDMITDIQNETNEISFKLAELQPSAMDELIAALDDDDPRRIALQNARILAG